MIIFENVSGYNLTDLNLNIPRGEIVGLLGASGSGKTTLLRLACGLLAPDEGRVRTFGKDPVVSRRKIAGKMGVFLAGTPLLDPEDTVLQGCQVIWSMYPAEERFEERYRYLAEKLDFAEHSDTKVKNLSLGQKMRAELGATLLHRPELIILDEPSVGLDENGKAALAEVLRESAAQGSTVLLSSHVLGTLSGVCTRLVLLEKGKLSFYGSLENLRRKYRPVNTMNIAFSGTIPDFDDLPVRRYSLTGNSLTLEYDSNHITAAEITAFLMNQTGLEKISIRKPDLEEILAERNSHEFDRSETHQ